MKHYSKIASKNLWILLLSVAFLSACENSRKEILAPETIYDAGLKVITSSFNNKTQSISILYGNEKALKTLTENSNIHQEGEDFRLITWKQKPISLWFGGNTNAELIKIEQITSIKVLNGKIEFNYNVLENTSSNLKSRNHDYKDRIDYILNSHPSQFPGIFKN